MKRFSERAAVIVATLAALVLGSPAHADCWKRDAGEALIYDANGNPIRWRTVACEKLSPTFFRGGAPDVADVAVACKNFDLPRDGASSGYVSSWTYPGVGAPQLFGVNLTVEVDVGPGGYGWGFTDKSDADNDPSNGQQRSQQAGTPGVEAIVAMTGNPQDGANIYCRTNLYKIEINTDEGLGSGIVAPNNQDPAKLTFYWNRGTCALDQDRLWNGAYGSSASGVCTVYNGKPVDPTSAPNQVDPAFDPSKQPAHFLEEQPIGSQRINFCGCPAWEVDTSGNFINSSGTAIFEANGNQILDNSGQPVGTASDLVVDTVHRNPFFCDRLVDVVEDPTTPGKVASAENQLEGSCQISEVLTSVVGQTISTNSSNSCALIHLDDGRYVQVTPSSGAGCQ